MPEKKGSAYSAVRRLRNDPIEELVQDWEREMPELNTTGLGVVGRILFLAKEFAYLQQKVLRPLGLETWEYEVIAALRRQGEPFELAPTRLAELAQLTTGAITNRLDRLEARDLVVRRPDPSDRRALRIRLTSSGKTLAEEAVWVRMEAVREFLGSLTPSRVKSLEGLLGNLAVRGDLPFRRVGTGRP